MASAACGTAHALRGVSTAFYRLPALKACAAPCAPAAPSLSGSFAASLRWRKVEAVNWRWHGARSVASAASTAASDLVVAEADVAGSSPTRSGTEADDSPKQNWKASIDFKFIRENKGVIATNIQNRKCGGDVEQVVQLYEQSVSLNQEVDKLRAERNAVAGAMKGKLDASRREELIEQGKRLKEQVSELEVELTVLQEKLQMEGQRIPNMTHPDVPIGSEDVATLRKERQGLESYVLNKFMGSWQVGSQREFTFPFKDHVELGLALDLFDFEAASEVSGTKFYYLKNEAVLLEMALINWTLSKLVPKGFIPLSTPDLVRSAVVEKCGFQPRGQNTQVYSVEGTDLCLAGTAEIPVGGMYMDSMLQESALPLKLVAYSHCFRTEAGAAGAATRGLYRVHQFSKMEMFVICRPDESDALHEELISIEEELYRSLGLHFKTLDMSTEDLGAPAYRKYDVEAWMPGLGRYGEISSASNCTDYQSRRLNIRYRPAAAAPAAPVQPPPKGKKAKTSLPPPRFAHTLNATACAVPRMMIAILENNQQEDGSVIIPEPLRPFMGGTDVIRPKSS